MSTLALAGLTLLPLARLPLARLPLARLPLARLPLARLPLARLPLARLPVLGLALRTLLTLALLTFALLALLTFAMLASLTFALLALLTFALLALLTFAMLALLAFAMLALLTFAMLAPLTLALLALLTFALLALLTLALLALLTFALLALLTFALLALLTFALLALLTFAMLALLTFALLALLTFALLALPTFAGLALLTLAGLALPAFATLPLLAWIIPRLFSGPRRLSVWHLSSGSRRGQSIASGHRHCGVSLGHGQTMEIGPRPLHLVEQMRDLGAGRRRAARLLPRGIRQLLEAVPRPLRTGRVAGVGLQSVQRFPQVRLRQCLRQVIQTLRFFRRAGLLLFLGRRRKFLRGFRRSLRSLLCFCLRLLRGSLLRRGLRRLRGLVQRLLRVRHLLFRLLLPLLVHGGNRQAQFARRPGCGLARGGKVRRVDLVQGRAGALVPLFEVLRDLREERLAVDQGSEPLRDLRLPRGEGPLDFTGVGRSGRRRRGRRAVRFARLGQIVRHLFLGLRQQFQFARLGLGSLL